jgi:iron complex outermembrane receptor protein
MNCRPHPLPLPPFRNTGRARPAWAAAALAAALLLPAARVAAQLAGNDLLQLKHSSLEDLMETEVTSVSRYPQTLLDTPSAIQVISTDDLRRSGAATIPQALELADNLDVAQKNPHDWAISARGFNSNLGDKMLVLVDGRSVYSPLFSGVFWNAQDYLLEDVSRIEAISGPGGTLWGANAVNGVINITTKGAQDTQGAYAEAGAGSGLHDLVGARYGGALAPNVYYRVYGKYMSFEDATLPSGKNANDGWGQTQGGFRIDALPSPKETLTLQGDVYSGDLDAESLGVARLAGGNVLGRWTKRFEDDSDVSLQVYYEQTRLDDPFGASPFDPAGHLVDRLETYDIDFQHHLHLGDLNQVIWGAGYRWTDDDIRQQAPNFGFLPAALNQGLYNAFVQDEIELHPGVFLTVGTKLEHNDFTGREWEPNVRLRWALSARQSLWAAVSRAVRTPSRLDRDLTEPTPPKTLIAGSADFDSETVIAYELGYRLQFDAKASASISTFVNDYDHLRSLDLTPVTVLPLHYENDLVGRTYGTEVSATWQAADWWQLRGGYDLLEEHVWVRSGGFDFEHALDETADPKYQFRIHSAMDFTRDLDFDSDLRFVDDLRVNNGGVPAAVPGYFELNLRLAWRATRRLELSVVGQNLLHPSHLEFGPPGPTQEQIQRTLFAKVAWRY